MKHVDIFNAFLNDVVNLNITRVQNLESSIGAIKSVVINSNWEPSLKGWMPQGSWAHKTIIKPVDLGEFDADLLVFVRPVVGWDAQKYIETLYQVFRGNGTYKDKVKRWSHCVTITYANEKKIDVAPCVIDRDGVSRFEVCNRNTNEFELSEPRRYTDWLITQNSYSGNNSFRKCTRLIKYLRDIKTRFTCSSVLLTTILGYRINESDKFSDDFIDTPTALKTIFARLDDWLQLNSKKPVVSNPFLTCEDFASGWTDEQYSNFRQKIHTYREWIDDAYMEQDRVESIAKWRRVFGSDFASHVVFDEGKSIGKAVISCVKESIEGGSLLVGDLVDAVKKFGASILPTNFNKTSYMEVPRWHRAPSTQQLSVSIRAELYQHKFSTTPLGFVNSLEPLQSGFFLQFKAIMNSGTPFSSALYKVYWRITNTDEAAAAENCLRGNIEEPESDNSRWEQLRYRGVHIVEAFVVNKRTNQIVGQSEAFRVMIE
ncbi:SMODS domain-containing nucleotidyltransferase [Acetobacter orleanensis]|uniref:Adenylyl/Guanylyl and SMODS C-terminal sensor domain-containing protein n=1 Tax=Acetobacter orleanensis TaxID=104099 RepID=A0A4Y3TSI1_9PROT|nr:nucleotidyltransferase [Acetobacter orleanensis]KXV66013.1 hypothetical protein AD949_03500 [Acetobacter orleanensis]PCD78501.1 nucleotidyltransferase [Acetobacter orleanensis]GAN69830.1 hypothetical protein Abol_083_002 [Acetobacter orleanensis JCM 7639]GBR28819.1 hypothetical protein AA0473_1859 [Acetobacter orleanensis NRIC 0473]GEB83715.1 hypothetical protein AOR01nite_21920 [Acetobacter orleanensis]